VLYHHERWDGGGYREGRAGNAIPLRARILAVADALDAMTCDRPYRRARPLGHALAEVFRCAGSQFDPKVVGAFLDAWEAGDINAVVPAAAPS
jgi:HD-GYP domain-containing protein (c-di-GMP phosphodiesterase class II)